MAAKQKHRFEREVHLGLLVIIAILLSLSALSNYIVYQARESVRADVLADFRAAALAVRRSIGDSVPPAVSAEQQRSLTGRYRLSELYVIPAAPPEDNFRQRRQWFASVAARLPIKELPNLGSKLLTGSYYQVTAGDENEYFYIYPVSNGSSRSLIVLSQEVPQLAFMDQSVRVVALAGVVSLVGLAGIYFLLSRFILSPFRRMKKQAQRAGRPVGESNDDVEAIVAEYEQIIDELQQKERELRRLTLAEQQRADSLEQFHEHLLSSLNSGVVTIDRSGNIRSLNQAAGLILAATPEEFTGQHVSVLLGSDSNLTKALVGSLRGGSAMNYREAVVRTHAGIDRAVGASVSKVFDQRGQVVGASLLLNDLSELQRLRTELETKNRLAALGEMSGGLAHQLRNSVGAITGYCHLLRKRLAKQQYDAGSVEAIIAEAGEAERLIERFLQFSRPLHAVPERVLLSNLISEAVNTVAAKPDAARVRFDVAATADIRADLDPLLFKQALTNILDNAVNAYHDQEGTVIVRLKAGGGCAHVDIQDFGCGIPEEDVHKIFTPFYSSRPSGTGLGLPLARRIVDLHKGSLTVTSSAGKGTTLSLTIPVGSATSVKAAVAASSEAR